jgi:ribonuclease P/MRP protein subunit RPP1
MSGAWEAVHAHPDGEATVRRLALTAAEDGYEGLVVRNHGDSGAVDAASIGEDSGIDVVAGVEVRAEERSRVAGLIGSHRGDRTVVCVHGGAEPVNRLACEDPRVDVLAHPTREGPIDHVLVRAAADNGVALEFSLARVLRAAGGRRVRALRRLRTLRELVRKYDAPHVVSADPVSHLQLRAPRELAALGGVLGADPEWVREGLAEWGRIVARNRERASERFIQPGVRRGRYEEEP